MARQSEWQVWFATRGIPTRYRPRVYTSDLWSLAVDYKDRVLGFLPARELLRTADAKRTALTMSIYHIGCRWRLLHQASQADLYACTLESSHSNKDNQDMRCGCVSPIASNGLWTQSKHPSRGCVAEEGIRMARNTRRHL